MPFPVAWVIASTVLACALLALAAWRLPWRRLAQGDALHVACGAILALAVLWSVRATVGPGVVIHLLGMGAFALLAGPWVALVGGAIVLLLAAWLHGVALAAVPTQFLASVVVPVAVMQGLLRFTQRFLPPNFFVYVFAVAFFGAWLGAFLAGVASATAFVAAGASGAAIFGDYVPYLLFLAFGEATLTGMLLTLAVVYRPRWVMSFDDAFYLEGR